MFNIFTVFVLFLTTAFSTKNDVNVAVEVKNDGSISQMDENNSGSSTSWTALKFHDTGIDELNWHDYLQFYWNTPILSASEDPEIHPHLKENIFPNLSNILNDLPQTGFIL